MGKDRQHPGFERIQAGHRLIGLLQILQKVLVFQHELLLGQRAFDRPLQLGGIDGLDQIVVDRFLDGFDGHFERGMPRHQDNQRIVVVFPHFAGELQARRVRELEIHHDDVKGLLLQELDRLAPLEAVEISYRASSRMSLAVSRIFSSSSTRRTAGWRLPSEPLVQFIRIRHGDLSEAI